MAIVRKYNPGFLSDEEVVASFCVRTLEFERIVETLSENGGGSSHMIVVGPRGSGKTHLLRRAAVEMRREERIAGYFPIEFAEETYEVSTVGEFWLEGLGRLAEQAPPEDRAGLRLAYDELRAVRDDDALAMRCLGMLLNFSDNAPGMGWVADAVDAANDLLGDTQAAIGPSYFMKEGLDDADVELHLLNLDECVCPTWLKRLFGRTGDRGMIRALQILDRLQPNA